MRYAYLARLVVFVSALLPSQLILADTGVCATASVTNPNQIGKGTGGTGAVANNGIDGANLPTLGGGTGGTGSPTAEGGIGGTNSPVAGGGTGGTGQPVAEGGIGGTNSPLSEQALLNDDTSGGIGIVGVITGFASICVDGEEVHYDQNTPVSDNGKNAQLANLAVGRTVVLKADRVNGRLQARAIGLFDAVSGPVTRADVAHQEMRVMGQVVRLTPGTATQTTKINNGDQVRVSGHRLASGEIIATRVDVTPRDDAGSTLGVVTEVQGQAIRVNGTPMIVEDKRLLESVKVGSEAQVSGKWTSGVLRVSRIALQPLGKALQHADSALLKVI